MFASILKKRNARFIGKELMAVKEGEGLIGIPETFCV
jgi:hypothetical protein